MFFPEIDKEKTKANVKRKLSEFRRWERVAGEEFSQSITATYSFQPKSPSSSPSKSIERLAIRKVDAELELNAIVSAINKINDPYLRQILIKKYCSRNIYRNSEIYMDLNYSETEFYKMFDEALLIFAEAFKNGILLVEILGENSKK